MTEGSTVDGVRISRVLVANRGEIARRVFATCRRLGIGTVAVCSEADADLPFVREADLAVTLPGSAPADTYLRGDLIVEAALRTRADAIHPGYGFLSENADFARAVIAAGLTWIGPAPESIEAMGSKIEAKKLMAEAGVPVFAEIAPGQITDSDLPVLVKASAGGGGRGMRVVRSLAELDEQVRLAADEAGSAFGDRTVFVEPYLEHGRHVEVQVIGTAAGVQVVGERDCSLQRRHQKILEEAPAPGLSDDVRRRLHDGARRAAAAIDYRGAGTVEFMVAPSPDGERISFLEMNTRLQVEHPVTEAVFGIDLVEAQIAVAEGSPVVVPEGPVGHAIEVRVYAEDPAADYQPQSGRLGRFEIDHAAEFAHADRGRGIRLDAGFGSGDEVGTFYDAMLAKVIAWAPDRAGAARSLAGALERARIEGVVTNRDQLVAILRDPAVLAGEMTTDLLGVREDLRETLLDPDLLQVAGFAAAVHLAETQAASRAVQSGIPVAWRNVVSQPQRTEFEEVAVEWLPTRDGYLLVGRDDVRARPDGEAIRLEVAGVTVRSETSIATDDGVVSLQLATPDGERSIRLRPVPRFTDPTEAVGAGSLVSPMPGTVVGLPVADGARVDAGETVVVLEAMKMQHAVKAPTDGTLDVRVQLGQQMAAGEVLAVLEEP